MDSVDFQVLKTCANWLQGGQEVLLVTVVKTWGSSPRPQGAMLAVRSDAQVVGSVSGGCIEDDLIDRVRRNGIDFDKPQSVKYGITAEQAHNFGLPCGGTIELVLEPLKEHSAIGLLFERLQKGQMCSRILDMASGVATLDSTNLAFGLTYDGKTLVTVFGPRYRMLVIGAGQLSRYLCQIATGLDYKVVVCDPREEYSNSWDVAGTDLVSTMPDDTVLEMKLDERCAVIALTHDPKLDDLALMEALKTPAFYVGALGSRKNNAARRKRLLQLDLTERDVARLHGPAGIYIASRTPAEIAVSIIAEITAVKNGVQLPTAVRIDEGNAAAQSPPLSPSSCSV